MGEKSWRFILTVKTDSHGVPPCVSRSATRSRALSCRAGCPPLAGANSFCFGERTPGATRGTSQPRSIFGRRPRSGRLVRRGCPSIVLLAGLAKSRVQPYPVYFQVEVLLEIRSSLATLVRLPWRLANRCADGVALDGGQDSEPSPTPRRRGGVSRSGGQEAISSGVCIAYPVQTLRGETSHRCIRHTPGPVSRSRIDVVEAYVRRAMTPYRGAQLRRRWLSCRRSATPPPRLRGVGTVPNLDASSATPSAQRSRDARAPDESCQRTPDSRAPST